MPHHQQGPAGAPHLTEEGLTDRLRAAGCVFAEDEARLLAGSGATQEDLAAMLDRRVAGFPLEHILGWVDFSGLRLEVQSRVAREADDWLAPGGHLLFEIGNDQEQDCLRLLDHAGFSAWSRSLEEVGATVVIGRRPA